MQKYVELNHKNITLRGFHHDNSNNRIVVMLHGYTGNCSENKTLFKTLSNKLEDFNIDSIRVNFSGHGDSDGQFKDIMINDLVMQGELILDYVRNLGYEEIYLLGFSMGGLISFNLLHSDITKVVLISPAVEMPTRVVQEFKELDSSKESLDIGGLELKKDFYRSLLNYDIHKYAESFRNKILVTVGTNDIPVPYQGVMKAMKKFKNVNLQLFEGCDHLYSSIEYRNKLNDLVINFLNQ